MLPSTSLDLSQIAQPLSLPLARVQAVVDLLDSGNTVPFITRYRKDQTGGLDEEQIRAIQDRAAKLRQLADRKQTILRSIEAQGKATPELRELIEAADTMKRLEDLYLPYKPKKQTLATLARSRGLEPLAEEILAGDPACLDLNARAADFVSTDRKLANIGDVLLGVGHILAETFSERADLRGRLRAILEKTGRLVSTCAEPDAKAAEVVEVAQEAASEPSAREATVAEPAAEHAAPPDVDAPVPAADDAAGTASADAATAAPLAAAEIAAPAVRQEKKKGRNKKGKDKPDGKAFRDFFDYAEALSQIPPHRVLAINRGERAKVLRVKIEADVEAMHAVIDELLVPRRASARRLPPRLRPRRAAPA